MKENEIKNAFDKIKLSKEKENLIANNIIENREIRTGKIINNRVWRHAAEVYLFVVLCAAVIVTPLVTRYTQENRDNSVKQTSQAALAEGSSSVSSQIPDKITEEYIFKKIIDNGNYYNSIEGKIEQNDNHCNVEFQVNKKTSEFYEKITMDKYYDREVYFNGNKTTFYDNINKSYRVYNFDFMNCNNSSDYVSELSDDDKLFIFTMTKAPGTDLRNSYKGKTWTISEKFLYLNRECVKLTVSSSLDKCNDAYYIDLQTGVILNYEVIDKVTQKIRIYNKFTEVRFDENPKVKTVSDVGNKYDSYRELMIKKTNSDGTMTATQTVGSLEFKMLFNKWQYNKGDQIIIKTTVKNIGNEPTSVYATTGCFGIQGTLNISACVDGKGIVQELPIDVTCDMFDDEIDPGESFSKEDIYNTEKSDVLDKNCNIEIKATLNIGDYKYCKTISVTTEIQYLAIVESSENNKLDNDNKDLTFPNASKPWDFERIDITVDSKKAIKFIDKNGKITILCTTEEDAEKAPKREEVINGQSVKHYVTSENAYRIGIEYIINSTDNIKYYEYMSDGTVRSYEVHPDAKDAKVINTSFIITDSPDTDSSFNKN